MNAPCKPLQNSTGVEISPPIGEKKKRGRPRKTDWITIAAELYKVSPRAIQRACRIRRDGVPELVELIQAGQINLHCAEFLSQFPHEMQRGVIAYGGAAHVKKWVALNRKAFAEETVS